MTPPTVSASSAPRQRSCLRASRSSRSTQTTWTTHTARPRTTRPATWRVQRPATMAPCHPRPSLPRSSTASPTSMWCSSPSSRARPTRRSSSSLTPTPRLPAPADRPASMCACGCATATNVRRRAITCAPSTLWTSPMARWWIRARWSSTLRPAPTSLRRGLRRCRRAPRRSSASTSRAPSCGPRTTATSRRWCLRPLRHHLVTAAS
mmetsp:Transcript_17150/g.37914  ORF Transcript_17150/g.37914 Transcript_17150/m.37914 type:complete len:207 (+) Transcript_17150:596-1216(+)